MGKKTLFIALVITSIFCTTAQESRIGVTAGYSNANSKLTFDSESFSESEGGFYFGLIGDLGLSENFNIQTEITYVNIQGINFLQIPIMAKVYPVSENGFNIQAGLQATYTLEQVTRGFTKFNLGLGAGLGYDITQNLFTELRYVVQLNNYITDPNAGDAKSKINFFNIGIGYKF